MVTLLEGWLFGSVTSKLPKQGQIIFVGREVDALQGAREGVLGCLLHYFPKFYNNAFLFLGLTTLGNIIEF